MTEPRARQRNKGAVFQDQDLKELLFAYGDPTSLSLPSTISTLDEILTDFIIETCHAAALCASYSRRQKIKADDFKWVLRHNPEMLGKVQEHLMREKRIKEQRKIGDLEAMGGVNANVEALGELAQVAGAGEETKKKGRGRGKRKRKDEDEGEEGRSGKRVTS